jgi:hypothetical protein
LFNAQGGRCFICGAALRDRFDASATGRQAAVDHDHALEARLRKDGHAPEMALRRSIRGLLCAWPCNRFLLRHWTADRLLRAAQYVATRPAQAVLARMDDGVIRACDWPKQQSSRSKALKRPALSARLA